MSKNKTFVISAPCGGSGKTMVSLGLVRHFVNMGLQVKPYKKGPDYIDYAWLALAARIECTCLDPYFLERKALLTQFTHASYGFDASFIEGNRGLYDGKDVSGVCSTAELARIIKGSVLLVINTAKATRTIAALVHGLTTFEKDLSFAGVILNNIANPRHESIMRQSIEKYTSVKVLGCIPRLAVNLFPERALGLEYSPFAEEADKALEKAASLVADTCDTQAIFDVKKYLANKLPPFPGLAQNIGFTKQEPAYISKKSRPTIGYVKDSVLCFYYQENLDALQQQGAELIPLSFSSSQGWNLIHGLYLGGGYPEHCANFSQEIVNCGKLIKKFIETGMPIYAEAGGFVCLGDSLFYNGKKIPMMGVLPLEFMHNKKPQGLGYIDCTVTANSIFFPKGYQFKGHQFHYYTCKELTAQEHPGALLDGLTLEISSTGKKVKGISTDKDFLMKRNLLGAYTQIYAPAVEKWAPAFVRHAQVYREQRSV